MTSASDKHIHLQMIQGTISRLANQSASVKHWYMVAWAALIAFALSGNQPAQGRPAWLLVTLLLALGLTAGTIDVLYLWQEKRFRTLYNFARKKDTTGFSMKLRPMNGSDTPLRSLLSWSVLPFYLPLMGLHILVVAA